jgi:hypothetical protein
MDESNRVEERLKVLESTVEALKKSEEALIENKERLELAQRVAHLGSWGYFVKSDEALWSEELFRIFGLKLHEKGPNIAEYGKLIYPDDLKDLAERILDLSPQER